MEGENEEDKEFEKVSNKVESLAKAGNYDEALDIAKKTEKNSGVLFMNIAAVAVDKGDLRNAFKIINASGKYKDEILFFVNTD